jgi:non-specific serine/threonine protein kinase
MSAYGIQKLERGITHPYRDTAKRLAAALELQPDDLKQFVEAVVPVRRRGSAPSDDTDQQPGRHNLPLATTSFVGRERELEEIVALLHSTRLVTLTGAGGCGKSRLAIETGRRAIQECTDGVWLVELAPLTDPELVLQTIAHCVGVQKGSTRPLQEVLQKHLQSRDLLVLLDNFEHLLDAAHVVSELLESCAGLKMLATSREALRIRGEQLYPVPALAIPASNTRVDGALEQFASVKLFVERAVAHEPKFAITSENATAIAEICRRLEGLPLAIELAAARVNVLSPTAILHRMDGQLSLLVGGSRDLPPRQRTLRDTIAWSYDLLDAEEQRLFCRLGVCVGGCSLEVGEALSGSDKASSALILDGVASLLSKNVLRRIGSVDAEPRFAMLESIREFALERLASEAALEEVRRLHAVHYLSWLGKEIPPRLRTAKPNWVSRLDAEYDNVRAAVRWALDHEEISLLVEAGIALTRYGVTRGYLSEVRRWWEEAFARSLHDDTADRPKIAYLLAIVLFLQGEVDPIFPLLEESLARFRTLHDPDGMGHALLQLGIAAPLRGDPLDGVPLLREAVRLFEGLGKQEDVAWTRLCLGYAFQIQGDYDFAEAAYTKVLATVRGMNEPTSIAQALAVEVLTGLVLAALGSIAYLRGDLDEAETRLREGLRASIQVNDVATCILHLAGVAFARGQSARAARLLGGAEGMWGAADSGILPAYQEVHRRLCEELSQCLDRRLLESARTRGRQMITADIVAYALEADVGVQLNDTQLKDLTRRELEVAQLAARGLSNREIAHNLTITEGTARVHVERVLSKLGLSSRSKLAASALEMGLLAKRKDED